MRSVVQTFLCSFSLQYDVVAFSSLARILGECLNIHSALGFFCGFFVVVVVVVVVF